MKYLKMLAVAALAATALMAVAGAGSASATVFCKTLTNPCTEMYAVGFEFHIETTKASVIEGEVGETKFSEECKGQTLSGVSEETGSPTTTGKLGAKTITWQECPHEWITLAGAILEFPYTAEGKNSVYISGGEFKYVENALQSCKYTFGNHRLLGLLKEGNEPTVETSIELEKLSGTGFYCTSKKTLTAKFKFTTPTPLYVALS